MVDPTEFYLFNYGSYPNYPHADALPNSAYIDLPNDYFDDLRGTWQLDSYLDSLVFGEKLGFDGILTTSQIGGPIGMTPSANLVASYLAAKTERIRIGTLGPILNTFTSPMRAAEDIALLDQLTRGRLLVGLPMGHGMNYHAAATMNPATARSRYWEAHDLMIKAFTTPGPFEWQGEHFHVPYANLWPRCVQTPHPEIWIPAAGSKATLEKAALHGYTYQALFSPRRVLKRNVATFREAAEEVGKKVTAKQVAAVVFIHVGETDRQARLEAEPHLLNLFQNINRAPNHDAFPPGHFSVDSLRGFLKGGGYRGESMDDMTYDQLASEGWAIIGSPNTVAEKLEELQADLGAGRIIHVADFGAMPNWMMRKSLTLMAEQVIPRFRGPGGHPVWAQDLRPAPTHAEYGAQRSAPKAEGEVRIPGTGVVALETAHIEELRVPRRP